MNEGLSNIFGYKPNDNEDYYGILGCDELSSVSLPKLAISLQ
jgi:hypothetical protein